MTDTCKLSLNGKSQGRPYVIYLGQKMTEARSILLARLKLTPEDAKGTVARHTCHNKACINPDHILQGTHKDNTQDMMLAGRWKGGPSTRFNEEECARIRADYRQNQVIAAELKVAPSTIGYVKNRQGVYK